MTFAEQNNRPSYEELMSLINKKIPFNQISKLFGVTDNCIRKWKLNYEKYAETIKKNQQV